MAKRCVVCGKESSKTVVNPKYPNNAVCLNCFKEIVTNEETLKTGLTPVSDALTKIFDDLKDELDKHQI